MLCIYSMFIGNIKPITSAILRGQHFDTQRHDKVLLDLPIPLPEEQCKLF